jgi:hypothetical protein
MKTITMITTIFTILLSSLSLANDIERNEIESTVVNPSNENSTQGFRGTMQFGESEYEDDGIDFIYETKKSNETPKKMVKGKFIELNIRVVNTTGKKTTVYGWFDFNNDGYLGRGEKVLQKKVKSTKDFEVQELAFKIKIPNRRAMSDLPTLALFEMYDNSWSAGPQNEEPSDKKYRKNNDVLAIDNGEMSNHTQSETGDFEFYLIQFTDEEPVAVTLSSFEANESANGIKLEWKVESEINHAGYNVYRSENEESGFARINDAIILGWDGFSAFDGKYEYMDAAHGSYYYKLEAVEMDGDTEMFGPYSVKSTTGIEAKSDVPESFELQQNYPNPFNPSTTISFTLAERTNVNITIFDMTGRIVNTLVNEHMDAGTHSVAWAAVNGFGESLPSGIYFYSMKTETFNTTKSMTIIK